MKYFHLIIGIILVALLGYGAYVLYPRFALEQQSLTLPLLALAAGAASFFSPCSFSLMVALLARESGIKAQGVSASGTRRVSRFALALALGASLFFVLIVGGLVAGASALFASVTFTSTAGRIIRLITGVALMMFGLMQLEKIPNVLASVSGSVLPLMRYQARQRQHLPGLSFFVLGFAYPAAGFG